ncbi:MAG: hypothetical protein F6K40_19085 [Okeania sp. SIO3I5]|uniref:caspase family protein n=1 Tax=Okeania sp. SIO3I5 TaxID=2607805 RepID=UPI0013B99B26|nr:caspase family protein [Okeania sp. SIO3I5]NEQ38251.1 hypothetical protein [Okeania sp. SIO3I5]
MANKLAITIGVQKYKFIPSLKYAANDAQKMRDFLFEEADFDEVCHYSDYSSDCREYPERSNIEILLEKIGKLSLGSDDDFWFFFSGHGSISIHDGLDYLMLSDSYKEDIQKSGISVNYVIQQLKKSGAGNVVLFLDMCRDLGIKSIKSLGKQTEQKARQMGMICFFSCSPCECSQELEEFQHGAFTYALLELFGAEKGATVKELNKYLKERVRQLTRHKVQQTPSLTVEPFEMSDVVLIPKDGTINDYKNEIEEDFLTPIDENIGFPKSLEYSTPVQSDIDLGNLEEYLIESETDNLNWEIEESKEEVITFQMTLQEILQEIEIAKELDNQDYEKQEELTQSIFTTLGTQNNYYKFSWKKTLGYAISGMMLFVGTNLVSFDRQLQMSAKLPKAPAPILNHEYNRVRLVNQPINSIPELQILAIKQFEQNDIQAGKMAVETLLKQGALVKAAETITAVPKRLSDHPEINFIKGRLAWELFKNNNQNNLIDEVINCWEKATDKNPNNIQYQNALGFAYYTKGDIEKAYTAWLKVLNLSGEITPEIEKNRPFSDNYQSNLSVKNREALNAYAGIGLVSLKYAQNLQKTPVQAFKYAGKVMREAGQEFDILQLQKNWLWSPRTRQDWDLLLKLRDIQLFEQNKYSDNIAVIRD